MEGLKEIVLQEFAPKWAAEAVSVERILRSSEIELPAGLFLIFEGDEIVYLGRSGTVTHKRIKGLRYSDNAAIAPMLRDYPERFSVYVMSPAEKEALAECYGRYVDKLALTRALQPRYNRFGRGSRHLNVYLSEAMYDEIEQRADTQRQSMNEAAKELLRIGLEQ